MRVKTEHIKFLKRSIRTYLPDAAIYLIGSRANNELKGKDIDILVIDEKELSGQEKRDIALFFDVLHYVPEIEKIICPLTFSLSP